MNLAQEVISKINARSAVVGVIGLGYAGLPLLCTFAEAGFRSIGFDIDAAKIEQLRGGRSYIGHISSERLSRLVAAGKLEASTDFDLLRQCDAAIICVPTPLGEGRSPDLRFVVDTANEIAKRLHRGQLVVLESTTYPGTTDEVVLPILNESGLQAGIDFFLAFSPEREDPANTEYDTRSIPKLIGGLTENCLAVAARAYGQIVEQVVPVSSPRVAEAAKLLENIYRCVNIALINELKLLFERMGIDVWEVVTAAATKPFGFTPFYPGPGLGGHCIPIDPFYLSWKARQYEFPARFIELAGEINLAMPGHVVRRVSESLNLMGVPLRDADILLLGVAYKRDIDDVRESPALAIIRLLEQQLARVRYHDPFVPRLRSRHLYREMRSVELTAKAIAAASAVVVVTDHSAIDYRFVLDHAKLTIDTRNATAPCRRAEDRVVLA